LDGFFTGAERLNNIWNNNGGRSCEIKSLSVAATEETLKKSAVRTCHVRYTDKYLTALQVVVQYE